MENIVINLCKTDQLLTPDSSNFLAAWRASFGLATGSWEFKLKITIFHIDLLVSPLVLWGCPGVVFVEPPCEDESVFPPAA